VCLAPISLAGILSLRSLAYFLGVGAKGILAAVLLAFFVAPLSAGLTLVVLFLISLVGAYGLGFLFAGVALVFKRTQALVGLAFSLMIFLTGALVGLESLGWIYQVLRLALPLTWGISLMRSTLTESETLLSLLQSGELLGLTLHSLAYLAIGLGVFAVGYVRARARGTLAHY
jgi:ABC-2 type transport system permease protein